MMHRVASSAVDDGRVGVVLPVVDEDGPDVDEGEESYVGELLEREEKREQVVGGGLREAIEGMEGVGCVRSGHDPFVVWFMQGLVDKRMVQAAVDPVDAEIGEENEEGKLEYVVQGEGCFGCRVVELCVATYFGKHAGCGQQRHERHGFVGLDDLEFNLVLEVFRMVESTFIENKDIG